MVKYDLYILNTFIKLGADSKTEEFKTYEEALSRYKTLSKQFIDEECPVSVTLSGYQNEGFGKLTVLFHMQQD